MKASHFLSLFVLCSLLLVASTYIQQSNSQYASLFSSPIYNGYLNSITLQQQSSGTGYVFNMTQNGDYIQVATASSTQNLSASISLSSNFTVISSASLESVSSITDASDANILSYLPYLDISSINAVNLGTYLGIWQVSESSYTFEETNASLPSSLTPQAEAYIGLGTSVPASYSPWTVNNPTFSLYFDENTVELIFGVDMTKAATQEPVAKFSPIMGNYSQTYSSIPTSWTFLANSLQAGSSSFDLTGVTAAFDINLNGILMPPTIYNDITSYLCSTYCSSCGTTQDDRNLTTCEISSASLLPSLTININNTAFVILCPDVANGLLSAVNSDNSEDAGLEALLEMCLFNTTNDASIPVSPGQYTFSEIIDGQSYTVFNFISDTNNGAWLILGSQVMSTYYITFSTSTGTIFQEQTFPYYTISLYQASPSGSCSSSSDNDSDSDSDIITQAYGIYQTIQNSDSETEDSESSGFTDSDGEIFQNLTNVQNLTAAVQQNYQKVQQLQSMVTKVHQATSTSSGFASILSDINQGINVIEPFLDTLGIFTGLGPVTSIVGSVLSLFGFGGGSEISAQLNQLSQEIATVSEQVSNLAQEIAAAAQDITQMMNVVSDDIVQVYNKISDLQSQQTAYFSTILTDEQADVCFAEMSGYASTILGGMQALQALSNITDSSQVEGFKTNFLDTCAFCPFALEGLLNAFNPQSEEGGCDIISMLTAGNATYHRNWVQTIAGTGGYLISLINMGLTVVSALESLQTNSSDAWMAVQSSNSASYQQAVQSLQSTIVGCYETYYQDAQWNVFNYTQEFPETATMGEITQLLSLLYPWRGWILFSLSSNTNYDIINYGQNFTVQLQTEGLITIQDFSLQNPLGLVNNNSQWIWQSAIQNCFISNPFYGSPVTVPFQEFGNSLSFIVPSISIFETDSDIDQIVLDGDSFGTNVLDSSGAVYNFGGIPNAAFQGEEGLNAYIGMFEVPSISHVAFYWPKA